MFDALSRYRDLPTIAVPDARGRAVVATDLRPLPTVTGTFRHTVTAGDRLDQLANRYYSQPVRYWRICDANPAVLSPLDLLGQDPVVTVALAVTVPGDGDPPWAAVLNLLAEERAVVDAVVVEELTTAVRHQEVGDRRIPYVVDQVTRSVLVTVNRAALDPRGLPDLVAPAGIVAGPPVEVGQLGQQIVIPVAVTG